MKWISLVGALAFLGSSPLSIAESDDARALLQQSFDNLYGSDSIQSISLTSGYSNGRGMSYELEVFRKHSIEPKRSLIRFSEPDDVRGTSILVIENNNRSDDIYVYVPALRTTRRIGNFQKADSFFGTDISYEDLEPKRHENYLVSAAGVDAVGDVKCKKIETRPKPGFESAYDRVVSCIDPTRAVTLWTEFYKKGRLYKRLDVSVESIRAVGTSHIPHYARVQSEVRNSRTEVTINSYIPEAAISDRIFSPFVLDQRTIRPRSVDR